MNANAYTLLRDMAAREDVSLAIRGGCMAPIVAEGDLVRVRRRSVYWPGDVIVFRSPAGPLLAHRVLGWRPSGLVTRGDTCRVHDAPVPRANVVGAARLPVRLRDRLRALAAFASIAWRRAIAWRRMW